MSLLQVSHCQVIWLLGNKLKESQRGCETETNIQSSFPEKGTGGDRVSPDVAAPHSSTFFLCSGSCICRRRGWNHSKVIKMHLHKPKYINNITRAFEKIWSNLIREILFPFPVTFLYAASCWRGLTLRQPTSAAPPTCREGIFLCYQCRIRYRLISSNHGNIGQ